MVDTIKMRRPDFRRNPNGPGGRVEHDALGNAVWTRSRATDSLEIPGTEGLSLVEESSGCSSNPEKDVPRNKTPTKPALNAPRNRSAKR